jgi:hypothetical protein
MDIREISVRFPADIMLTPVKLSVSKVHETVSQRVQGVMSQSVNPLAYTNGCKPVWATDVFAFGSSFLSVDGMTCHISF